MLRGTNAHFRLQLSLRRRFRSQSEYSRAPFAPPTKATSSLTGPDDLSLRARSVALMLLSQFGG
jgi:hypothetical protein